MLTKYQVPAPRYTSYPAVPHWETEAFEAAKWPQRVQHAYTQYGTEGISLYLHLPYCESLCTYCGCNTHITVNHGVEEPYIAAVLKEWQMYREVLGEAPKLRELHLGGGTPTFFSPAHLRRLIEGILASVVPHADLEMSFEAHPANTTREHLEVLYDLGFRRLSLGIQDFAPEVQRLINRTQTLAQVAQVVAQAREIGYTSINFDLLYGLPKQTGGSLQQTFRKVLALKPDRIAYYGYAHVPWMKPAQTSFAQYLPNTAERQGLYALGRKLCQGAGYEEVGMDHFALPGEALTRALRQGTLHRNFMGYTTQPTHMLLGLGASSISDVWEGFAQNVKSVKGYLEAMQGDELPLMRGHVHTAMDRLLRGHILNLICHYETTWTQPRLGEECALRYAAEPRLRELAAEGLITLTDQGITVTELGRPYIRNICQALDLRYWAQRVGEVPRFSQAV